MRIKRKRRADLGPTFTLDIENGAGAEQRPAKYGGETMALLEAQSTALALEGVAIVRVYDEDQILFTVTRTEDGEVLTRMEGMTR